MSANGRSPLPSSWSLGTTGVEGSSGLLYRGRFVSNTLRCPFWTSVSGARLPSRDRGDTSAGSESCLSWPGVMGSEPLRDVVSWTTTTLMSPPGALAISRQPFSPAHLPARPVYPWSIPVHMSCLREQLLPMELPARPLVIGVSRFLLPAWRRARTLPYELNLGRTPTGSRPTRGCRNEDL